MDKFDEMIKSSISKEKWEVPESLDDRLNETFENLNRVKKHKKISLKLLISVAIIMTLMVTTVLAINSDEVRQVINTVKLYFQSNKESKYKSGKENIERFSNEVGITVEQNGIKFTLDSIAMDDNYIISFYTIESEKSIPIMGDDLMQSYYKKREFPIINSDVDGKIVRTSDYEAYFESDKKIKGVVRTNLNSTEVRENAEFTVRTTGIFGVNGRWEIKTKLDKSKIEPNSRTIRINKRFDVKDDYSDWSLIIKKVSISPLGNQIVFSNAGNFEKHGIGCFALFDDKGNVLDTISTPVNFDENNEMAVEFLNGNKNSKYVKIVPIKCEIRDWEQKELVIDVDKLPVEVRTNSMGSIVIDGIEFGDNYSKVKYHKKGLAYNGWDLHMNFTDEQGNDPSIGNAIETKNGILRVGTDENAVNRKENGFEYITMYYKEKCDFSKYKQIRINTEPEYELMEDKAIQIDLQ